MRSTAYLISGVVIFFSWPVSMVLLLLVYLFYHVYLHYHQMHPVGLFLVFVVPAVLATMNLTWFWEDPQGIEEELAKR
ncbi:hypothetical protein C5167_033000, partial [Papaver somniferum]